MAGNGINVQTNQAGRVARNSERKVPILQLSNEIMSLGIEGTAVGPWCRQQLRARKTRNRL
jgi:hypothetical protein